MHEMQGFRPLHFALRAAADAEQQVDYEVERSGRDGDDVEAFGVQVALQGRYRVEQECGGGLEQSPEAEDGLRQHVGASSDIQIDERYVGEDKQDDQGEYRADEAHASISFPSRPTLPRPGWLRGVFVRSLPHRTLLPMSLLRASSAGSIAITLADGR